MRSILSKIAPSAAAGEVKEYWRDDSGAHMAVKPCGGIPDWLGTCPTLAAAVREIELLRGQRALHVMVNKLPPGTIVPVHSDTLAPTRQGERPRVERWHLPLKTNPNCYFWDESDLWMHMALGSWWGPVPYWLPHSVENTGTADRIHLVVDLDTPERVA